jgi:PadR family transcriptional regulator, regulatory protein PadR
MIDMNSVDTRSYAILASLVDQPRHGYAILKRIEELFPLAKRPAVATMYATLERLESEGLVEIASEEIVDGRARRTFALTDSGRLGLAAEAERMANAAGVIKEQLAASSISAGKPRRKPERIANAAKGSLA